MPIRPRITGRARPENDTNIIRLLGAAIRDGEIDKAIKLMDEAVDIVPRVQGMADRGDLNAKKAMLQFKTRTK